MKVKIFDGNNWVELGGGGWDYNVPAGNDITFKATNGISFGDSSWNRLWFDGTYLRAMVDDGYEVTLGSDGMIDIPGLKNLYNKLNFNTYEYRFHMQQSASDEPGYYNDTLTMSISYSTCYISLEDTAKQGAHISVYAGRNSSGKYGRIQSNGYDNVTGFVHNLHIYNTTTSGNKCNITCVLRCGYSSMSNITDLVKALYDAGHRGISSMLPANGLGYTSTACVIGIYASSRTASSITVVYTTTSSYLTSTFTASTLTITDLRNGQFSSTESDI